MALQPFDYTLKGIQDPASSFMTGMKQSVDIQGLQAAREEAKLKQEQAIRAQAQQEAMAAEMAALAQRPTVEGIRSFVTKNPSLAKNYEPILNSLTAEQKSNYIKRAGSVYAALKSGRKDLAISQLDTYIEAARNSGKEEEARNLELQKKMLESPETGQAGDNMADMSMGIFLAIADPDNFIKNFEGLGKERRETAEAPAKQAKAEAEASLAATKAKFAESEAALDLQKKGWDIKKIESDIDIAKENSRIALLNASINRESNDIKRQEMQMKLQDMQANRDKAVREKAYEAETAIGSVDESTNLISDILADDDTLRTAIGKSAWRSSIIGTKAYTMAGKIEQLQNSIAATNLDKLKGAMSDKDIIFLKNIATNLSRYQNEDEFIKELKRIQTNLNSAKAKLSRKYGAPVPSSDAPVAPQTQRAVTVDW